MDRSDIDRLFELLRVYFPRSRQPDDKRLRSAWLLLLEPYEPGVVRAAVVEQLREVKSWPDAQEIAVRCNRMAPALPDSGRVQRMSAWERESVERLRAWQAGFHRELRERGLPSLREAVELGRSPGAWHRMMTEAGL